VTDDVVTRVLGSPRYRDVDRALVARLAGEELPRARNTDDAVKRVKRRLHQAVGAYRGGSASTTVDQLRTTWSGAWDEPMRRACRKALERHASTRERAGELDRFYPALWEAIGGAPRSVLDLACGLNPFALPFMGLAADAEYRACDADGRVLGEVDAFLALVGQPHRTWACDLAVGAPGVEADVALLLKTVPLLDRQDPHATLRLLRGIRAPRIVVSFPVRSLGGRGGLERSYRARMEGLLGELGGRLHSTAELRFNSELAFVLTMVPDG